MAVRAYKSFTTTYATFLCKATAHSTALDQLKENGLGLSKVNTASDIIGHRYICPGRELLLWAVLQTQ